jgi:hypothetical protein
MMKLKKLLTIFVAVLIISLPVCFATSIGYPLKRSSGEANIDNYGDGYTGDIWNITVEAEIGGLEIRPTVDIWAAFTTPRYFDSCQESITPNYYDCTLLYTIPIGFPEGEHSVDVVLKHPIRGDTDIKSAIIKVDSHDPTVTINSAGQGGYNVSINFNVEDGGNQVCSIDWIEFIDTETSLVIGSFSPDPPITDCNAHNYDVQLELLDVGTTTKAIEVRAYDALEHVNEVAAISDSFVLDHTPPFVDVWSLYFEELGSANFISGDPVTTDILINVTEESDLSLVLADFSSIGGGSAIAADVCNLVDTVNNIHQCEWYGQTVTLPNSFSVTITAIDEYGNGEGLDNVIQRTFSLDATAPGVEYLGGIESYYVVLGDKNVLRAEFYEGESGINSEDIALSVEGINPGYPLNVPADRCIQQGTYWNCYWNVTATQAGEISLTQVKDRAGNLVPTSNLRSFDVDLLADIDVPSVTAADIKIYGVGFGAGAQAGLVEFYEEERDLYIEAIVTDASGVKATANFGGIISNTDEVEAFCLQEDGTDTWICEWTVGPLASVTATTPKNIEFVFEDFVGNEANPIIKTIEVLDVGEEDINPDFWSVSIGASIPAAIDRRLVNRMFPYSYAQINLDKVDPTAPITPRDQWPLLIKDLHCTSDWVQFGEIMNYNSILPIIGSSNPLDDSQFPYIFNIKLNLIQLSPENDSIEIPCTFKTMSYINGQAIPNPEVENVNLTVNYFNNPLGEMADQVQAEIDDVKEGWLIKAGWLLGPATEIISFLEVVCHGLQIIHNVKESMTRAVDQINNCCLSVWASAACCPAKRATGTATVATDEAQEQVAELFGNKFCKALNCQLARKSEIGKGAREAWDEWVDWAAQTYGSHKGYFGNVRPENSIILSVIFLCLKGVVYNLEKARQIECRYVYCLEKTAEGMPVSVCVFQRAMAMCKYVFNQIFNLIPFAAVINDITQNIFRALANWGNLLLFSAKILCRYVACQVEGAPGCEPCSRLAWFSWFTETLCDLGIGDEGCKPFWETMPPIQENFCNKIEDDEDET